MDLRYGKAYEDFRDEGEHAERGLGLSRDWAAQRSPS